VTEDADTPTPQTAPITPQTTPILLCYDGSEPAKHAIEVAHAIAGDRPATVLHLWQPPGVGWMTADAFGGMPVWGAEMNEIDVIVRERAGRRLAEGVNLATEAGFAAQGRLESSAGSEWRMILDIADELDAQLIVLGARGLSAVESAIIGSVSNGVIHHAKRPVLVVPASAERA